MTRSESDAMRTDGASPTREAGASLVAAAERAALLFQIVEGLGVKCGYERSFKMLERKLLANRFMIGINTADATRETLLDVCRRLNMPGPCLDMFRANLADANLVFLGFEDNQPGCVYKVYLEYWNKLLRGLRARLDKAAPALLHLGFKWRAEDNAQGTTTRYICHPLLSVEEILSRISTVFGGEMRASTQVALDMVRFAAAKAGDREFVYLEVDEGDSLRKSFDINLYRADRRVGEVWPLLTRLRDRYSIPAEKFERLHKLVADQRLGHLSGGVNSEGKDFLTVYYEV